LSISGAYQVVQPPLSAAEALGQADADKWGCTTATGAVLSCLRALPAATARTATGTVKGIPSAVVDGKLLRESTTDAFAGGRFNKVPTIVGSAKDETSSLAKSFASAPLTAANWASTAASLIKVATADELSANYDITKYAVPTRALTEAYGDYRFFCGAMTEAQRISQWVPQSWGYEFAEQNPALKIPDSPLSNYEGPPLAFFGPWGDHHSSDTAYWFGQFQDSDKTPSNLTLSAAMRGYLANFARTGNPNGNGLPMWKPLAENAGKVMDFASPLIQDIDAATNHHCPFWGTKPPSDSLI
jgi:para-nitrobenzyl esterase